MTRRSLVLGIALGAWLALAGVASGQDDEAAGPSTEPVSAAPPDDPFSEEAPLVDDGSDVAVGSAVADATIARTPASAGGVHVRPDARSPGRSALAPATAGGLDSGVVVGVLIGIILGAGLGITIGVLASEGEGVAPATPGTLGVVIALRGLP